ncbi:MAG TPA: penicillin-binding transpeptidase domain-containing protein [Thermoanaerobaculia bacterium]|jgi:peptidoglycan glycosyltransferase|nr:penicillin-binding transpeptidase domain-containing protein [Thermoanaerobaculia bacterium]
MTADYVQSREVQRPRGRLRRLVLPLLITLVILIALLFAVAWLPLRQGRDAWLRGDDAGAIAIGEKWSRLHLWPAQYHQLLAAAYLTSGPLVKAEENLTSIGNLRLSIIPKDEIARRLFAREHYSDFLSYDAASRDAHENADVPLYRAAALLVMNREPEAQKAFASIDRAHVNASRYASLLRNMTARASGDAPYVFDRNGGTIATVRANDVIATNDDFVPLINREAGALTIGAKLPQLGANATIETTLDPFVQKAALKALAGFRGSLVAIDPRTNEILAIASSPGKGTIANLALEHQYEPGSVVKVLTGLNALNSTAGGVDVMSLFPYTCKGFLDIDGRHFGDWLAAGHGTLNSIDDALAVSCNIFFADLGIRLGVDRLTRFMTAAGFNGQADLGLFQVPLGKTVGQAFNHFETAFLAIGLEHESMNALHVAMIASMMANRGELTTPNLLVQRRSILGDVVATAPKQGSRRLASPAAAETMVHAMEAVATEARGTGRRAPVAGISLAMKTGTAGERKSGLEALILAFAPVQSPKIAFGVIAEDAGPAEFAGAKIAHDFLEAMAPRLR